MTTPTPLFHQHQTLTGRRLVFRRPAVPVQVFLDRLEAAAANPTVDEDAFIELLYGVENPLLRPDVIIGRGAVTAEVFANPVWHVMQDLHGQKRVALGRLDLDAAAARHTLTVAETAVRVGTTEAEVREAIDRFALSAWRRDGRWMLDPTVVDAYALQAKLRHVSRPGVLALRIGAEQGHSLQITGVDTSSLLREGDAWVGEVSFSIGASVGVLWKRGANARFWRIEPGGEPGVIANEDLFVRGCFTKTTTINNPARARAAFDARKRSR